METIENLIEELQKLNKAKDLLQRVYVCVGPYTDVFADEGDRDLQRDINNYFGFDDSE